MNQGYCAHSDEEVCIVVTWVVDEVCKAVEFPGVGFGGRV